MTAWWLELITTEEAFWLGIGGLVIAALVGCVMWFSRFVAKSLEDFRL